MWKQVGGRALTLSTSLEKNALETSRVEVTVRDMRDAPEDMKGSAMSMQQSCVARKPLLAMASSQTGPHSRAGTILDE